MFCFCRGGEPGCSCPGTCLVLNGIRAGVVTPAAMGCPLRPRPGGMFVALTFWTWERGIVGCSSDQSAACK